MSTGCLYKPWTVGVHLNDINEPNKLNVRELYSNIGKRALIHGEVAFCVLAGGQGTRLGCTGPKGKIDPGLLRPRSLFQIQAERFIAWNTMNKKCAKLPLWLIMTSHTTHQETIDFFQENDFFGYSSSRISFFQQGILPCLGVNGETLVDLQDKPAVNPDGSGGIFPAMKKNGIDKRLLRENIKILYVYNVDNLLVKLPDEEFLGWMIHNAVDVSTKVVRKNIPTEAVGVFCENLETGKPYVVEYSELSTEQTNLLNRDQSGLEFWAGNAGMYAFSDCFLKKAMSLDLTALKVHRAWKKIPHRGEPAPIKPNAWKQETFIFDWYFLANNFMFWEIEREIEFAPLKNADPSEEDSPGHARVLWNQYWIRKMLNNGVIIEPYNKVQSILSKDTVVDQCWIDLNAHVEFWTHEDWQVWYNANNNNVLPINIAASPVV